MSIIYHRYMKKLEQYEFGFIYIVGASSYMGPTFINIIIIMIIKLSQEHQGAGPNKTPGFSASSPDGEHHLRFHMMMIDCDDDGHPEYDDWYLESTISGYMVIVKMIDCDGHICHGHCLCNSFDFVPCDKFTMHCKSICSSVCFPSPRKELNTGNCLGCPESNHITLIQVTCLRKLREREEWKKQPPKKRGQKEDKMVRKAGENNFGALVVFKRTLRLDLPGFKSELFHSIP